MKKKKNLSKKEPVVIASVKEVNSKNFYGKILALVFILPFCLYINTVVNDFALDDVAVIQQNKFTKQGIAGIDDMLLTFYWQGYWDANAGLYRPLSLITFAIEYQLFGENPHVFHFVNIVLYSLICFLLFIVLQKLLNSYNLLIPLLTTLFFAAHPLHTEVVANIKSRDELLSVMFFLLSLLQLLKFTNNGRLKTLVVSLVCYFFSLFSKEGAMVYLGIFPLTLFFFTSYSVKRVAKLCSLYLLPAILFFALHTYVISNAPTPKINYTYWDNALVAAEGLSRLATALYIMGKYLIMLFYPHPLSYDYSFNQIPATTFGNIQVLVSIAAIAALFFVAIRGIKNKSIISYGIFFFFITIALVSNIFMLIGATMADRFLFVPSLGFCLILAFLLTKVLRGESKKPLLSFKVLFKNNSKLFLITGIIISLYSFKTISRNRDWKNNFTLFEKDVNAAPGSSRTQYNYGTELLNLYNKTDEQDTLTRNRLLNRCISYLETSAKIDTNAHQSFLNLASAYYQKKDYQKSIYYAQQNLRVNPLEAKAHSVLGNAYYRLNQFDKSIYHLNLAIEKNYFSDDTYIFLGGSYFGKEDFPKAIAAFNKALELKPGSIDAYINLGAAYGSIKDYENAIKSFRAIQQYEPNNLQSYYYMALTFNNMGLKDSAEFYLDKYNALITKNNFSTHSSLKKQ